MTAAARPRVLVLQLEFTRWQRARHWSYVAHFGVADGLRANGADTLIVPTPWLSRLREVCAGRHFDQVWMEVVHTALPRDVLEWIAGLAPVRVGMLGESLTYTAAELAEEPGLAGRRAAVEARLEYLTHVLAVDEADAADIAARRLARALWWPQAVPARFVTVPAAPPASPRAAFAGAVYGPRGRWLDAPSLATRLERASAVDARRDQRSFDALHRAAGVIQRAGVGGARALAMYVRLLRALRTRAFRRWLAALRAHAAIVNLPHAVKAYPGRVWEGMAAGRAVASWAIPDRPRTRALFEDGAEILLFEDAGGLCAALDRLAADGTLGDRLAANARRCLLERHTAERRVAEILAWLDTGREPAY